MKEAAAVGFDIAFFRNKILASLRVTKAKYTEEVLVEYIFPKEFTLSNGIFNY